MKSTTTLMLLALSLSTSSASAQTLWDGTRYGMSPAQVQQRFPKAQVPDVPDGLAGGETEGLRLVDARLAGREFQASFFFGPDGLVQVMLRPEQMPERAVGMQLFEDVARALATLHGSPQDSDWKHEPVQRRTVQWKVDGATVKVFYTDAGTASIINVIYQARLPDAPPGPRLETRTVPR